MEETDYCNVLVISSNSFSLTKNNGKTLSSLFWNWPKEKVRQLYFYPENPDFSICVDFLRITDEDMLRKRKLLIGERIREDHAIEKSSEISEGKPSKVRKYRNLAVFGFLRNILWSTKKWDNPNLWKWLRDFKPEAVMLVGGGAAFPYKIAREVAKEFGVPIILYFTDDYITPVVTVDPFWWINFAWLKSILRKTLPAVEEVFVIGEDMAREYEKRLRKPCVPIMNSVDVVKFKEVYQSSEKNIRLRNSLKLAYFGGLHLNRWRVLVELGKAIKELGSKAGVDIELAVYSSKKPDKKVLKRITDVPYSRFAGSVSEEQIITEMKKYDVLVHVESFDWRTRQKTRLSISTKIPEYLATGKLILAIGPKELSSIEYLRRNKAAYIVGVPDHNLIGKVISDIAEYYRENNVVCNDNIELAKRNHRAEFTQETVRKTLNGRTLKSPIEATDND